MHYRNKVLLSSFHLWTPPWLRLVKAGDRSHAPKGRPLVTLWFLSPHLAAALQLVSHNMLGARLGVAGSELTGTQACKDWSPAALKGLSYCLLCLLARLSHSFSGKAYASALFSLPFCLFNQNISLLIYHSYNLSRIEILFTSLIWRYFSCHSSGQCLRQHCSEPLLFSK